MWLVLVKLYAHQRVCGESTTYVLREGSGGWGNYKEWTEYVRWAADGATEDGLGRRARLVPSGHQDPAPTPTLQRWTTRVPCPAGTSFTFDGKGVALVHLLRFEDTPSLANHSWTSGPYYGGRIYTGGTIRHVRGRSEY
jgi:hypothetical protein